MFRESDGCCKFSIDIVCTDHRKCAFCGWNPEVQAERQRLLREIQEKEGANETDAM